MARFVFRLAPLLRARRHAEQQQQRRVAEIERDRLRLEDTLRQHQRSISQGKQSVRDRLVGRLDTSDLRIHAGSSLAMMRKAHRVVLELAGVHRRLEQVRADLIEATQRRRALELLRDQRHEQWKADQNKAETAALDDLASTSATRKGTTP